jgi:CheY-like chemotaxis protein
MTMAPGASRSCVMVVDDSPTALCLLQAAFENANYDVVSACDGLEGLRKIQERCPDVIVTDSVMPGLDGFAFVRRLRESAATRAIPIVMLTSDAGVRLAAESGPRPDRVIAKSAEMEPLISIVRSLLAARRAAASETVSK